MSYMPLLEDLTTLGDELAELGDGILTGATKAGARHSSADTQMLQEIAEAAADIVDLAVELGADDPNGGDVEDEDAPSLSDEALKSLLDDPLGYAQHECGDIAQACQAMQAMAMLMASELSEGHEDDEEGTIAKLAAGMRALTDFISREIDAIEDAGETKTLVVNGLVQGTGSITIKGAVAGPLTVTNISTGDWKSYAWDGTEWSVTAMADSVAEREQAISEAAALAGESLKAQRTFGGKDRADLKDEDFAGPNRTYPIVTAGDVSDAARLIGKAEDPDAVKKKIIAIAKRKGFPDAVPEGWLDKGATKGIEFVNLDDGEEIAVCPGYSVKTVGDTGLVSGYLVKFGGEGDLSQWRDIFTPDTDFGSHAKTDVWVHHRMLPGLGKRKMTNQADLVKDDVGIFMKHLLNLRDGYERALYGLVHQDKLGLSSGTAPHLVDRKAIAGGKHEVVHWSLGLDASYTPTPAGGFDVNASALKSIFADAGIDLLNAMYDGAKTEETDRQRAILLEIGLLELETV